MTLVNYDGFDAHYFTGAFGEIMWNETGIGSSWDSDSVQPAFQSSTTRFSRGASASPRSSSYFKKTYGFNATEMIVGSALSCASALTAAADPVTFYDTTTKQCTVTIETDSSICLRRGSASGTIVSQTAAGVFNHSAFEGYAFRVKFSATVGEFQIWKDGTSIWSVSGLNNISTGNAYATKHWLGTASNDSLLFDDYYAISIDATAPNTFPGDVTVYTLFPNGAGSSTQWTPDSGSNYARVNEAGGNEDSSYVADPTAGHLDEYTLDDMPGGFAGTILAVEGCMRVRKDDASTRQVALRMKSGSTNQNGTTVTCGSAYITQRDLFVQDWDSVGAWTATIVNALKLGPLVIT